MAIRPCTRSRRSTGDHVNPIGPRACYDEGKRCAETLFYDYHRQHNVNIRVAMILNTYGPRMHPNDGRVVSTFVVQALQGKPLTVFGDGGQTLSFCYVDDLIDGLMRLMAAPDSASAPVNIGNPGEYTILQIAETVREVVGAKADIRHEPLPTDDPRQRRPDIGRAQSLLGWQPRIQLREDPARTIAYFEDMLANPLSAD